MPVKEEKSILKLSQLPPEQFQRELDSLTELKTQRLAKFIEKTNTEDPLFKKLVKVRFYVTLLFLTNILFFKCFIYSLKYYFFLIL